MRFQELHGGEDKSILVSVSNWLKCPKARWATGKKVSRQKEKGTEVASMDRNDTGNAEITGLNKDGIVVGRGRGEEIPERFTENEDF